ncbi:EcsC protein family protein [Klenkia brasiliensis]|uniref:EcsC protein family protein n=1 Tax=Klenkia brasiliensis TaxID=333142 RepID=A0A1G7TK44_9ACTN|nr:EcsC protein family protein [Klenkia brasiliensis]
MGDKVPQSVKDKGGVVLDAALLPAATGAARLIDLATDWAAELTDPEKVLEFHRENGREVRSLQDLRGHDLEHLDALTRRLPLRMATLGAAEGAALGALAMVPVAGGALAISADLLVIHVLTTSLATRITYAYGFDARSEIERHMVDQMVRRTFTEQAAKASAVHKAANAFGDGLGRVRWSEKLRNDHKIMAALEKLMKQVSMGRPVPVTQVTKALPVVAIAAGAGTNAHLLRDTAVQANAFAQTRFLAEKYDLRMPAGLTSWGQIEEDDPLDT